MRIYADNAATTKMSRTAVETMVSCMEQQYGNPSSLYELGQQAKEVLAEMLETGDGPAAIVERRGMKQVSDAGELEAIVEQLIADNPDKVEAYRNGKKGLTGFFVGQAMKATKGQGNPKVISQIVTRYLEG